MRNKDLIAHYFSGAESGSGSNLYINGNRLIEYSTTLVERVPGGYIVNDTKYSRTTSKVQTWINYHARNVIARVNNLNFGVSSLADYVTENIESFCN